MPKFQALAACLVSILLWGSLALMGAKLSYVPPFFMTGFAFLVGSLPSLLVARRQMFARPSLLAFGTGAFFGYHVLFFMALRLAPPVEANLVQQTWPLLIVLLSTVLLKGFPIRLHHVIGGIISFSGVVLIVSGGEINLRMEDLRGYFCALTAAFIWSTYSVLSKRIANFPTAAIGGFCFLSGVLSFVCHFMWEKSFSLTWSSALALFYLGLGPMGIAFYTWNIALQKGDPRIVGALSYLTPLLSTLFLVVFAHQALSSSAILAMVLIIAGALLGSKDLFLRKGNS